MLETIAQVVLSGLLMGLIYALVAAGLSLIFGLMDVVNFAHGELRQNDEHRRGKPIRRLDS